jgi:hypothetical protein
LLLDAAVAPAEIYRWVDASGIVHLDDDISRVPESERDGARVFRSKVASRERTPSGDAGNVTQASFARTLARELGLMASDLQDPVSVLQVVGIYPSMGWHPAAPLTPAAVQDVVTATRAAARGRRLRMPERGAEAAALRVATALGVAAPPASAPPEPPAAPPAAPPIVIAPNIVVEAPPPVVVVSYVERPPPPVFAEYPGFVFGVPFAPLVGPRVTGPVPERIPPLFNPAGRLHGPGVTPFGSSSSFFTRPAGF